MPKLDRSIIRRAGLAIFLCLAAFSDISPAEAADNAQFVSQAAPSSMICGKSYIISITMKNTGTTTWTNAAGYKLGSQNPQDNYTWGIGRAELSASDFIAPNQTKTFAFIVNAPSAPGTYNLQWRMLQEGVTWFGDYTTNISVSAAYATGDGTVTIPALAIKPIQADWLLDDFRYLTNINVWYAKTGVFGSQDPNGYIQDFYITDLALPSGGAGCTLQVSYDIRNDHSYCGYFSELGEVNISPAKAISFWVWGNSAQELFKVELKTNNPDPSLNTAAVYIADYLDGGVAWGWKQVTIPIHAFTNISDWTSAKALAFVFENDQCRLNGSSLLSTIWVYDIRFGATSPDVVRIDHFGDKLGTNSLGGNIGDTFGSGGSASYAFSATTGTYHNYANSFQSTYNVNTGWAGHYFVFGGGETGWFATPHDFSEYTYISFYVRAASDSQNPSTVKIELVDNASIKAAYIINITTGWQLYRLPLAEAFPGIDKTTIKQMNIIYEDWRIAGKSGDKAGVVYFDEIQFDR